MAYRVAEEGASLQDNILLPAGGNWSLDASGLDASLLSGGGLQVVVPTASSFRSVDILTGQGIQANSLPYQPDFLDNEGYALSCMGAGCLFFAEQGKLRALRTHDGVFKGTVQPISVDPAGLARDATGWAEPDVTGAFAVTAVGDVVAVMTKAVDEATGKRKVQMLGFAMDHGAPSLWPPLEFPPDGQFGPVNHTGSSSFFCLDGRLLCHTVQASFSEQSWSFPRQSGAADGTTVQLDSARYAPQVSENFKLAVCLGADRDVYAVNLRTGAQRWVFSYEDASALFQPAICEALSLLVLVDARAANGKGRVSGVDLKTGALRFRVDMDDGPLDGALADPVVEGTTLFLSGNSFRGYDLARMATQNILPPPDPAFSLKDLGRTGTQVTVVNGSAIFPAGRTVVCRRFTESTAAYFDGAESSIVIPPADHAFNPGSGDFTFEAWVRTSTGGEVICAHPEDGATHGARFNIGPQGELRFAVMDKDGEGVLHLSDNTSATDGRWHHVAAMRRQGQPALFLDGVALKLSSNDDPTTAIQSTYGLLPVSEPLQITIGCAAWQGTTGSFFSGLIKDVRIWDLAVEAPKLLSRMGVELTGAEPRLSALLRLDESAVEDIENRVSGTKPACNSLQIAFTDLSLDKSAFPYLLNQAQPTWPYSYAAHWAAKGEEAPASGGFLDVRTNVLCFRTGNALYGVHAVDGQRAWALDLESASSAPAVHDGSFYVMTAGDGLLAIDAASGEQRVVPGLEGLSAGGESGEFVAPVISGSMLVVADLQGGVHVRTPKPRTGPGDDSPLENEWWTPKGLPASGLRGLYADESAARLSTCYAVYSESIWSFQPATPLSDANQITGDNLGLACAESGALFFVDRAGKQIFSWTAGVFRKGGPLDGDLGTITGLAASQDLQLLVATTSAGIVAGFSRGTLDLRWTRKLPAGLAGAKKGSPPRGATLLDDGLLPPQIFNQESHFLLLTHVYTAVRSGLVAVLDARDGYLLALLPVPSCITTPLTVDARSGTIFFGSCDVVGRQTQDGKLQLAISDDGSLQSVAFGATRTLGLNTDQTANALGQPAKGAPAFVAIDVAQGTGLEQESVTVEAWVNTVSKGELLSVCPAEDSPFGISLRLLDAGSIQFTCTSEVTSTAWKTVAVSTVRTAVNNGVWHHVAAVRKPGDALNIYLDGNLVPASAPVSITATASPGKLLPKGRTLIYIGADAQSPGAAPLPGSLFRGLLGEVRIWDTFRTPIELASAMHTKLRGNEADLLAYWNFDYQARGPHNIEISETLSQPSDLHLMKPV
ncbi:hypothetical protein KFL_000370350 [Klebsormidium nitens]|uniref:Laminin G domain-containing protein n=1 Tax=Klebsormidium nitens TaxID=105231 RepID=A0A1Y1HS02_KLENI|nr:hypothetical protein KFL_000370350 [Klebsormidium nitens]|eukprot:GAQ79761.1 hypothetical protein KFL_000370350 [Klebsormidium nitens]